MPDPLPPGHLPPLEDLIALVREQRSFDFASYPTSTFEQRVADRLQALGIDGYDAYVDRLATDPTEFDHLFDALLGGSTGFFADPATWHELELNCLPALVAAKGPEPTLRIWVAGTASGHEAYSAAMLGSEVLGREAALEHLKVHATDIDADALDAARRGWFPAEAVEGVPDALRERYLRPVSGGYAFDEDLRRRMIFGRHDLLHDMLIPRIDLLVCRNVLMYFSPEAQARLVERFELALAEHGYLVLGNGERLLAEAGSFEPVGGDLPIFSSSSSSSSSSKAVDAATGARMLKKYLAEPASAPVTQAGPGWEPTATECAAAAFEWTTVPQILIDADGRISLLNRAARAVMRREGTLIGQPVSELDLADPSLRLRADEIVTGIAEASARRRPVERHAVAELVSGGTFDVGIVPVPAPGNRTAHLVAFHDATDARQRNAQLDGVQRELEAAYEELRSMNGEVAAANADLRSTVAEMEAVNAELDEANQALEQMDRQLAAAHGDVGAVHDQLRAQTTEVDRGHALLAAVLDAVGDTAGPALLVLDGKLTVLGWNRRCTALWGLAASEARGRKLSALPVDVPDRLLADLVDAAADATSPAPGGTTANEATVDVTDRSGRRTRQTFHWTRLGSTDVDGFAVFVSDDQG